jgi:hypothetical protein
VWVGGAGVRAAVVGQLAFEWAPAPAHQPNTSEPGELMRHPCGCVGARRAAPEVMAAIGALAAVSLGTAAWDSTCRRRRKWGTYYAPLPYQNRLSQALRSLHFLRWKRKSIRTLVIAIILGFPFTTGGRVMACFCPTSRFPSEADSGHGWLGEVVAIGENFPTMGRGPKSA